eukprot:751939-Hanusia_phi.AAC.1
MAMEGQEERLSCGQTCWNLTARCITWTSARTRSGEEKEEREGGRRADGLLGGSRFAPAGAEGVLEEEGEEAKSQRRR